MKIGRVRDDSGLTRLTAPEVGGRARPGGVDHYRGRPNSVAEVLNRINTWTGLHAQQMMILTAPRS